MWVAWLLACSTVGLRVRRKEGVGRAVILTAAVVMTAVYLIPHSFRGSELNYAAVQAGANPSDAIGTGQGRR